jgi:molybdopterin-guanine dinucleotide biosynthesis adapter protein
MSEPAIVGCVGPSGVGKTTLLEQIVATLDGWGVRVGVVKHSCHAVAVDREGKDSHRLYGAGAAAVALAMPGQIATFRRTAKQRPGLREAIATLPPDLDTILVEGFHWEPIPRYVVLAHDRRAPLRYTARGEVLGVIVAPMRAAGAPPLFDTALVARLAHEIAAAPPRRQRSGELEL